MALLQERSTAAESSGVARTAGVKRVRVSAAAKSRLGMGDPSGSCLDGNRMAGGEFFMRGTLQYHLLPGKGCRSKK